MLGCCCPELELPTCEAVGRQRVHNHRSVFPAIPIDLDGKHHPTRASWWRCGNNVEYPRWQRDMDAYATMLVVRRCRTLDCILNLGIPWRGSGTGLGHGAMAVLAGLCSSWAVLRVGWVETGTGNILPFSPIVSVVVPCLFNQLICGTLLDQAYESTGCSCARGTQTTRYRRFSIRGGMGFIVAPSCCAKDMRMQEDTWQ